MARRICAIVSDNNIRDVRLNELKGYLTHQLYPEGLTESGIRKAKQLTLQELRTPKVKDTDENLKKIPFEFYDTPESLQTNEDQENDDSGSKYFCKPEIEAEDAAIAASQRDNGPLFETPKKEGPLIEALIKLSSNRPTLKQFEAPNIMFVHFDLELKRNMVITEMGGKKMKAMLVFAFCIEYIKDKVLDRLRQAIPGLDDDDVHWVLTVPAIWNDQARQFMIEASLKAGIGKDKLTLALEPEGAAMYCQYLEMNKTKRGEATELKAFEENARFMVVDLGGGTIDITVSEVLSTGQLREIYNATGGAWGGNYINDQIIKTLKEVIGWNVMGRLRSENFDQYLELLRDVENRKRSVKHNSEILLKINGDLHQKIEIPDSFKKDVQKGKKGIKLSASLMKKIFSSSVDSTMKHVEDLLRKEETRGVSTILLVGGYAASDFVQLAFREKLGKKYRIIFPLGSDMTVLKGAVITGHRVESIVGRMAKCHYGLAIGEGEEKTFFSLIKKGQKIKVGDAVTKYDIVLKAKTRWTNLEIYTSDEDEPHTVIDEDHFTKVGSIHVKLPLFKKESLLSLTISYDETEFKVITTDKKTGRCFVGNCRFLAKDIMPKPE
ncbi:unnamed protein product [Mytilus coruscus]|uniref:HSPA12A n=1 Tax=Mytilus coruscus TaxID=42192 RepID=A0A6J8BD35_MYTCO|nr:unnamed protein product [Mytilus coruscus]